MDDDIPGDDPVLLVEPDPVDPVDPDADVYDDSDEGADNDGTPITSVHGSENDVWKDA